MERTDAPNAHEHIAREAKATKLAEIIITKLSSSENSAWPWLIEALDRGLFEQTWLAAASEAGVNPPSELTKQIVAAKVRHHFANPTPSDPFDGLLGR